MITDTIIIYYKWRLFIEILNMTHFIWVKFDDSCQFWHYFAIGLFRVSTITWMSSIHFGISNTSSLENGWTWNFKLGHQVDFWVPSSGTARTNWGRPRRFQNWNFWVWSNLILHHRIVNEKSFPVSKNAEITFSIIVILKFFRWPNNWSARSVDPWYRCDHKNEMITRCDHNTW